MESDTDGTIAVDDPDYGRVAFRADGTVEAEGRRLDPAAWSRAGQLTEIGRRRPRPLIQRAGGVIG